MKRLPKWCTKENFESFLKDFSPKTKVAPRNYGFCDCPIAKFIKFYTKADDVHVFASLIGFNKTLYTRPPIWLKKFIIDVDKQYRVAGKSVSAQKALDILTKI
ncbi:MAG: hypothetical protein AABY22_24555 [Nanoarchaeota archaeon]